MLRYLPLLFFPLFAQPWIPKHWVVVAVGNTAARPSTCNASKHAYINTQTSSVDYCTAANTWTSLSSGAVSSVFSRTGAVVATSGDYTAAQVTNAASLIAANSHTAGTKNTFAADATTAGAKVTCSALPSTPATGDVACDSGDANKIKWWDGSSWLTAGSSAAGLGDPGSNSVVYRTSSTTSAPAKADQITGPLYCADAGGSDAYACSLSPAITAYVTGSVYQFKANTANTGAATINFNSLGATTIKKVAGGVTTDLADNDIRSGQVVTLTYDGTNMQMQSTLGNAPSAGSGGLVLVEQHTASASASLDFTTCISGTYDDYLIRLINVVPATNAVNFNFKVSTDGGSTWEASNYSRWLFGWYSGGTGYTGGTSLSVIQINTGNTLSNSSNLGITGTVRISGPASSAYKRFRFDVDSYSSGGLLEGVSQGGAWHSATAVNAFQFYFSSGNISSGTIRCYGLAK